MLEPSKPRPSSNTPSSNLPTGIVKCCHVPKRSQNRRSTALTSFSRHRARTSRGVLGARGRGTGERNHRRGARLDGQQILGTLYEERAGDVATSRSSSI